MQTVDVDALLDRHRDRFRKLLLAILDEETGEDPFRFPLSRFKVLSDNDKAELVRRADQLARERVDRELEARRASWLVLVGGDVVLASPDPQAIPPVEEVLRLGEARDLVPYLFEAPLIEELPGPVAPWTLLEGSDRYPTIPISILGGSQDPIPLLADLDTGSHGTLVDADLAPMTGAMWFSGRHLGRAFYWSPAHVDIGISAGPGQEVRRSFAIRRVRDWKASPFVRVNPTRKALVGRDFLRAFSLSLVLRSREAETEIVAAE